MGLKGVTVTRICYSDVFVFWPGLLESEDGCILKALQKPPRGSRELHFYEKIFQKDCADKHILELQLFMPQFYGSWHFEEYPEGRFHYDNTPMQ